MGPSIYACQPILFLLDFRRSFCCIFVRHFRKGALSMARQNRCDIFDLNEVGCFPAVQRTVRRAWLYGSDPVSGKSFEHWRTWIQNRLQELAASFGIDCLSYAVMFKCIHVILRNWPDIVAGWPGEDGSNSDTHKQSCYDFLSLKVNR